MLKRFIITLLATFAFFPNAWAERYNIQYSTNYLLPAYVNFNSDNGRYTVKSKINVPLYSISFEASGYHRNDQFLMTAYRDIRNGKLYAGSAINGKTIQYGKAKKGLKTETIQVPVFDLFSVAFQLSYYETLPTSFIVTNGKKLYPVENVQLKRSEKSLKTARGTVTELTYSFKMGSKDITVKKHAGEKFPRFISYERDGDRYVLEFSNFVNEK